MTNDDALAPAGSDHSMAGQGRAAATPNRLFNVSRRGMLGGAGGLVLAEV